MQNVNLYVAELQPEKKFLTATSLAVCAVVCAFLMVCITFFARYDLSKYEESVFALEQNKQVEKENVDKIRSQVPSFSSAKIDEKIEAQRSKIAYLSRVKELIDRQQLGNRNGYSKRLQTLSVASNEHLSLSKFRFSNGAQKVEVSGVTRSPVKLTEFVDSVKQASSFDGAKFGPLTLTKPNANRNVHTFAFGFEKVFDSSTFLVEVSK